MPTLESCNIERMMEMKQAAHGLSCLLITSTKSSEA